MSNFSSGYTITNAGSKLMASVEAGKLTLKLTKMQLGSGTADTVGDYADRTALFVPQNTMNITGITTEDVGNVRTCLLTASLTSEAVETGYEATELGIFAQDSDGNEILYGVCYDTAPGYIACKTDGNNVQMTFKVRIITTSKATVELVLPTTTEEIVALAQNEAAQAMDSAKAAATSASNAAESNTYAQQAMATANDYASLSKDWAESGTSPDGSTDTASPTGYTQSAKIWAALSKEYAGLSKFKLPIGYYNSVDEMRKSETAIAGRPCVTLGYYEPNDGGGGVYVVRSKADSDTDDGGSVIFLDNNNVAELIMDGAVNVRQFGAKGDGKNDDTISFQNALACAKTKALYVPPGTYEISTNIFADDVCSVTDFGTYSNIKPVYPTNDIRLTSLENIELRSSMSLGDEGYQGFCYNSALKHFICAGKKTDDSEQTLYVLNEDDFSVVKSRKYTELAHANTLTYNPDNHKIYCLYDSNAIAVINEETLDVERTFKKNDGLTGLAYDPVTKLYVGFGYWGNNANNYFYIYDANFELLRKIKYNTQRTTNGLCMYNGTIIALFIGEIHEFSILSGLRKVLKYDDKVELEDVCMKEKTLIFNSNRMGTCAFFSLSSYSSAERTLYKNRETLTNIDLNNLMIDGTYKTLISKSEDWKKYHFPEPAFNLHVIVNSVNTREHIIQNAYRISTTNKNNVFYRIYQDGEWTEWFTTTKFVDASHPHSIGTWYGSGFITGDRTVVFVSIPCIVNFPAQVTNISITGNITIRQNNDYIVTNTSLAGVNVQKSEVGLNLKITIPVKDSTINNSTCGIELTNVVVHVG